MSDMLIASETGFLTIDVDATALADAADYYYQYVGPVFRDFAKRMGRRIWQKIGWIIQCKSAYTDTTLNLTEANFVDWDLDIDGEELYKAILVSGANNDIIEYTGAAYGTPYSLIINHPALTTEEAAAEYASQMSTDHADPVKRYRFIIDYDDGTDYSALDIGKTVDVNLYSGTLTITAGLITSLTWSQESAGHLMVVVEVEVV